MKSVGRWFAKVLASAAVILLVVTLLPYALQMAEQMFPELSGAVQIESATLMRELKASRRLETERVSEDGVLTAETSVVLLGTVGKTTLSYRYEASLGIDLGQVELKRNGKVLTFLLPPLEVISDHIEATEVHKNDFLSHAIDREVEDLLEEQRQKCRAYYLQKNEHNEKAWADTKKALEETVGSWLNSYGRQGLTFAFETKSE